MPDVSPTASSDSSMTPGVPAAVPGQAVATGQNQIQAVPEPYSHTGAQQTGAQPEPGADTPAVPPTIPQTIQQPAPVERPAPFVRPAPVRKPAGRQGRTIAPLKPRRAPLQLSQDMQLMKDNVQPNMTSGISQPAPLAAEPQNPKLPPKPGRIYSYSTSQVWRSRRTDRIMTLLGIALVLVLIALAMLYWTYIGAPTSPEDIPLIKQLLNT